MIFHFDKMNFDYFLFFMLFLQHRLRTYVVVDFLVKYKYKELDSNRFFLTFVLLHSLHYVGLLKIFSFSISNTYRCFILSLFLFRIGFPAVFLLTFCKNTLCLIIITAKRETLFQMHRTML